MIFPASRSVAAGAAAPLAFSAALLALIPAPASAQTSSQALPPVVVSSSRFGDDPAAVPIGATVISAEDIREAGIGNVNEAIRRIGGVYGRYNTRGTPDYSLDLRGFGSNSDQNLVVLVDGVRLSENEQTSAVLSSIPIETVERIEIVRGGSSVLYGEGATAGTIQIITRRADRAPRASIVAELGSFGQRDLRASIARSWGAFSADANLGALRTDNYRDNNANRQNNFSGGLQWALDRGRMGIRAEIARQDSRFAGALTQAQFEDDPRQSDTPNDYGSADTERYTAFFERELGAFELAAELSRRESKVTSFFDFGPGSTVSESRGRMTQFSPRMRHVSEFGGRRNELVLGIDVFDWARRSNSAYLPSDATQQSQAIYVRDQLAVADMRVALGVRREFFDKDAAQGATELYSVSHALTAWELQGDYQLTPLVKLFAKTGKSYRVANVDDNNSTPVLNQPLQPQTSRDYELGVTFGNSARKLSARVFRHRLRNEIFFDPTVAGGWGANVNLDPTRRQGIELEGEVPLFSAFVVSGSFQHVAAEFTGGPNAGREMILVPRNTATLRLNWLPGNGQSADVGVHWVGSQRYGSDFANTCAARIPSFVTLDARYAHKIGPWELSIAGSNLTDKSYYTQAFACQGSIYPEPGRQLKIALRREF